MKPINIILLTHNRPDDLLKLLKSIVKQKDKDILLDGVDIINSGSTSDYSNVTDFIKQHPEVNFKYEYSTINLGATKGRNALIKRTAAPIIVQLDDDAYFLDENALVNIVASFEKKHDTLRPTGIVAFKVIYESTNELQISAFPHKKINKYKNKSDFLTYYFAGCGLAIKKEACDKAGLYPEDFFYYMEEYDLAYRVMDKGFAIAYDHSIVVMHSESPLGRLPTKEKVLSNWVNKSVVTYRYLPLLYFGTTAFMWSLEYLKLTSWDFKGWWNGWKKIIQIPGQNKKQTISKNTLSYLRKVEARLWY